MPGKKSHVLGPRCFELIRCRRLIASRKMPESCEALRETGASYLLDQNGTARQTGIGGGNISRQARTPTATNAGARWIATPRLLCWPIKLPTRARLSSRGHMTLACVFDVPNITCAMPPSTRRYGQLGPQHDPGVDCHSTPPELVDEVMRSSALTPGKKYIYGFVCHRPKRPRIWPIKMLPSMRKTHRGDELAPEGTASGLAARPSRVVCRASTPSRKRCGTGSIPPHPLYRMYPRWRASRDRRRLHGNRQFNRHASRPSIRMPPS